MRIRLGTPSAVLLQKHGVTQRELEMARIFIFNCQLGGAITLPFPFLGPSILIKRKWLVYNNDNELQDSESIRLLRHEFCHVRQMLEWGTFTYLRRHILARFKTRSILARSSPEESECYAAQAQVEEFYRRSREAQQG